MNDTTSSVDRGMLHRVINACANNPVAAKLLTILLLVGGLHSASLIEVVSAPEVDLRQVNVTVAYPGATADQVETEINRRVEEQLIKLKGVREVTSNAMAGRGEVIANLDLFVSQSEMLEDIRVLVDRMEMFPPPFAEQPIVSLAKADRYVARIVVRSATVSYEALRHAADQVREDLLLLDAVSLVTSTGVLNREISLELDEETLREHGLTIEDVADAIDESTGSLTFGELRTEAGVVVLGSERRRIQGGDFADVVLKADSEGALLRIGDVSKINDGFEDVALQTELDGVPAVFLDIRLGEADDWLQTSSAVREWLPTYEPPRGVEVVLWDDRETNEILNNILGLLSNVGVGFVLVLILLAIVFDLRVAMWVAIGVPVAFLGACLLFPAFDMAISVIAIFGLFIVIGIVVDDAVVVGESIADQHEQGLVGTEASTIGASRVVGPVGIGVLTTIVAFVPMFFTYGRIGQTLHVLPMVVTLVLVVSLIEAFLILPAHLSHRARWSAPPLDNVQRRVNAWINDLRDRVVVPIVATSLRRPLITILCAVLTLVAAALIVVTDVLRFTFMDIADQGQISVNITFPQGTPFEVTTAAVDHITDAASRVNENNGGEILIDTATVVGEASQDFGTLPLGVQRGTHLAWVNVYLVRDLQKSIPTTEFERQWREEIGTIPGSPVMRFESGGRFATIEYAITHPNDDMVAPAIAKLRSKLESIDGVSDIYDSLEVGKRQYELELTPLGIAAGLTATELSLQMRARFFGIEARRILRGTEEIKVMVRYPSERRRDIREMMNERIVLDDGTRVPLSDVARIVQSQNQNFMFRVNGNRAGLIGGFVDVAQITTSDAHNTLEPVLDEIVASDPGYRTVTAGVQRDIDDVFQAASLTVPLAIAAIYVMVAVLLRSYMLPFVALVVIPLAAAGAVLGHLLLAYDLSIASVFGILAVSGVVINDTLVLLDRYRTIKESQDIPSVAAIAAAARQRFRAIFLTTATTVVGLAPILYFDTSLNATMFLPVVISIIFGLIVASAGVIFLLPAVLLLEENMRDRLNYRRVQREAVA